MTNGGYAKMNEMPTYVYECSACEEVFEVEQRITEDALTKCILCPTGTVKRVIQPVGISFKGSGFYVNDSQSKNPASAPTPAVETPKVEPAKVETPATITSE